MIKLVLVAAAVVFLVLAGSFLGQRKLIFLPTHHQPGSALTPWKVNGTTIGYAREVAAPDNVWLMLHGNAGQAADRTYALPCFSPRDSVFILEYPGYGTRAGSPSKQSFDTAAADAYRELRSRFPHQPVCVAAESIGSGPASTLAAQPVPPDKFVLVVPFDNLVSVATEHMPFLPVRWMLRDRWNNIAALSSFRGPVEIYGAEADTVIPIRHANALAQAIPGAVFHRIRGGHNDWANRGQVRIRNVASDPTARRRQP